MKGNKRNKRMTKKRYNFIEVISDITKNSVINISFHHTTKSEKIVQHKNQKINDTTSNKDNNGKNFNFNVKIITFSHEKCCFNKTLLFPKLYKEREK